MIMGTSGHGRFVGEELPLDTRFGNVSARLSGPRVGRLWVLLPAALSMGLLVLCVLAAGWVVCRRISWDFENEWVEGQIATSCVRVVEGLPLYPSPSAAYVGDNYPPFYFWFCGMLTGVFQVS